MSDYSQPEFYRFNQDSLKLVHHVASKVQSATSILDLGAGCGVIGIELANKLQVKNLCLVEIQDDFIPHLHTNIKTQLNSLTSATIRQCSFGQFSSEEKFDLIVTNPPYFFHGHGQVSKDQRKHVARTFIEGSWKELLSAIKTSLAQNGTGFIVVRKNQLVLKELKDERVSIVEDGELLLIQLPALNVDRDKNSL